jgi:hypothetical protein
MAREQFVLSDDYSDLLIDLTERCGLKTKTSLVENALVMLAWAVREVEHGRSIASMDPDNKIFRELHTPALQRAAARNSRQYSSGGAAAAE